MTSQTVTSPIGEVPMRLAGRDLKMKFGGRELVEVQKAFPDEPVFELMSRIISNMDLPAMFTVTAIAVRRTWPAVNADLVADAADEVGYKYIATTLMQAFTAAFPDAAPADDDSGQPDPNGAASAA